MKAKLIYGLCLWMICLMAAPHTANGQSRRELRTQVAEIQREINQLQILNDSLAREIYSRDTLIKRLRADSLKLASKVDDLNFEKNMLEGAIKTLESAIKRKDDTIATLANDNAELNKMNAAVVQMNLQLNGRLAEVNSHLDGLQLEMGQVRYRADSIHSADSFRMSGLNTELGKRRITNDSLRKEIVRLQSLPPPEPKWLRYFIPGLLSGIGIATILLFIHRRSFRNGVRNVLLGLKSNPNALHLKCLVVQVNEESLTAKVLIRENSEEPIIKIREYEREPIERVINLNSEFPLFVVSIFTKKYSKEFVFSEVAPADLKWFKEKTVDPVFAAALKQKIIDNAADQNDI